MQVGYSWTDYWGSYYGVANAVNYTWLLDMDANDWMPVKDSFGDVESKMKQAIYESGPIYSHITVYPDFYNYAGGKS